MAKEMEIYFDDLKTEAQKELLDKLETTPQDENWDAYPIAVIVRYKDN